MRNMKQSREPRAVRAIEADDLATVRLLLAEGFPERSQTFWDQAFQRLHRLGGNAAAGVPLGYFLLDRDVPVGVMLTPASLRRRAGGIHTVINLSSWYVRPEQRWRAGLMQRAVLNAHDALFTDLSATQEVRRMLEAFGFTQLNAGVTFHALALTALEPVRKAVVHDLDASSGAIPADTRDLLEAHRDIGCLAAVLEADGQAHALLLKKRWPKGLPGARLLYCSSNAALARHLPALSRYLMRRGMLLLETDTDALPGRRGQLDRPIGLKFAKALNGYGLDPDTTDYAGSELAILDL